MARLTAGQTALILDRLKKAGLTAEADQLEQHIDALTSENRLLDQLQQVTAATVRSAEAESATASALKSFEVVVARAVSVLDRNVRIEERRIALDEAQALREAEADKRAAALEATQATNRWKLLETRYTVVWGPIIVALTAAISAAAGWYFGGQ